MTVTKKICLLLLILIISIPVVLFGFFVFIGPSLNDARSETIKRELSEISLPPSSEIVEIASYCGNTSGTGNHVEIWAGVLIHTDLPEEEIIEFFDVNTLSEYQMVWHIPEDLTFQYPGPIDYIDHAFSYSNEYGDLFSGVKSVVGYYIVGGHYEAFTQWDIRGY